MDKLGVALSFLYSYMQFFWKVNLVVINPVAWEFEFFLILCGFNEESRIESIHIAITHSYE